MNQGSLACNFAAAVYPRLMRIRLAASLPALLLVACAELDEEDSRATFKLVAGIVGTAGSQAQNQVRERTELIADVELVFDCDNGGTTRISGSSASCVDDERQGELELTIEVDGCTLDGITLDGTIEHTADQVAPFEPGGGHNLNYHIEGTLTARGSVAGECELDVRYRNSGLDLEFSGVICGHDAAELVDIVPILPPWYCPR